MLGIGGARVASGDIPVSTLIAFLLCLFYLMEPLSKLVDAATQYQEGAAAISRLTQAERLSTEPPTQQPAVPAQQAAVVGPATVRFEDASFRYRADLADVHHKVGFAAPDATDDDIRDVLTRARVDALVGRLPEGLEPLVGHRGSKLPGGKRQRIAIARALLRKPRLLLLDEATSQLDAVNELALRDVIAEVARETTVLVIAHRLSTVIHADRIVVMEAGRVRSAGTHADLMDRDPLYAQLAATQLPAPAK